MASQRTVRDTANSFYVVATNAFGTAWAHHFIRNVGGSDVTDTGGTWPCWRYCGTAELPAYTSNPKLPAFIYSEDTGSQDYAVKTPSGTQFLGSYHGGDVIRLQSKHEVHICGPLYSIAPHSCVEPARVAQLVEMI